MRGVCSISVILIGNWIDELRSNHAQGCLCFTSCLILFEKALLIYFALFYTF